MLYALVGITIIIIFFMWIKNRRRRRSEILCPDLVEANIDEIPAEHTTEFDNNTNDDVKDKSVLDNQMNIKKQMNIFNLAKPTAHATTTMVFECLQGLSDNLSGYSYQIKLFTLYAIQNTKSAISRSCKYELATEAKDLIPFDDIYLKTTKEGRNFCEFVQVKQTKSPESNFINQSNFFTMLKQEKNFKELMKGNNAIVKMFIKFENIKHNNRDKDFDGKFIYCTNTRFCNVSCPCFKRVEAVNRDLLCGLEHEEWCVDPDYLYIEIKYVLLNLMQTSKQIQLIMDEEFKHRLKEQIIILDGFIRDTILNNVNDIVWHVETIATHGLKIIKKRIELLDKSKIKIQKARITEDVENNLPEDCEIVCINDLEVLKKRACSKIKEVRKILTNYKDMFECFSYDEIVIRNKICNFVSHFRIYTDCASSNEIDEIIASEITDQFNVDFPGLISAYCLQYFSKWISEFKNEVGKTFTHTDGKFLFSKILIQLFNEYNKSYIEELVNSSVQFNELNQQVINFLSNENNDKILHVITRNSRIHMVNIFFTVKTLRTQSPFLDYVSNIVFTSTEIINTEVNLKNILYAFNFNESDELLVLECLDVIKNFQNISNNLKNLIEDPRKKFIIISNSNDKLTTTIKNIIQIKTSYEYLFKFNDLTRETREAILDQTINFQNNPVSIKTNMKIKDFISVQNASETIDEDILSAIFFNTEDIMIGNNYAFVSDEYKNDLFIPRHMLNIDIRILKDVGENLFFITGISQEELASKILLQNVQIWEEGKKFYNGIVLMPYLIRNDPNSKTNKEIFGLLSRICKNSYWLEFHGDSLYRKGVSRGSENNLEEKLAYYKQAPDEITNKIIIVANNPGEGKSTMLTHLANSLKNKSSNYWIIRVNLKKYIDSTLLFSLNDISSDIHNDTKKAVEFISHLVVKGTNANTTLEKKFLQEVLNTSGTVEVVLLFDGYDEISPLFKQNTCILLKALANSHVRQLWITTRIHLKEYLEEQLQVPAYTMASFSEKEQVQVLCKLWACHLNNYCKNKEEEENTMAQIINQLKFYVENLNYRHRVHNKYLNNLELSLIYSIKNENIFTDKNQVLEILAKISLHNWTKSTKNQDFLKVPLNLEMLGRNAIQRKYNICISENIELSELYEEFVQNKLKIYLKDESKSQSTSIVHMDQAEMAAVIYRQMHREVAVRTLFEPSSLLPNINICSDVKNSFEKLTRGGLVKSYHEVEFVHRSFAEYFFSEYIFTHIDNALVKFEFFGKIFLNDEFHLVRKFLDGFLSQRHNLLSQFHDNHEQHNHKYVHSVEKRICEMVAEEILKQESKVYENALHVAVLEGHVQIYWLIFNNVTRSEFLTLVEKKSREGNSIFHLAIINENPQMFKTIVDSINIIENQLNDFPLKLPMQNVLKELLLLCDMDQNNTLHLAAIFGQRDIFFHIIEILRNDKDALQNSILKINVNKKSILHLTANDSNNEMCELILKIGEELCVTLLPKDETQHMSTLFYNLINLVLILMFIIFAAYLLFIFEENVITDITECIGFNIAFAFLSCSINIIFILFVIIFTCIRRIFNGKKVGKLGWKRSSDILKLFMLQTDIYGMTALHIATEQGDINICKLLLITAAKYSDVLVDVIFKINADGRTALHIGALNGCTEICDLILKTTGQHANTLQDLISRVDKYGNSALNLAAKSGSLECYSVLLNAIEE